ncbi:MAG: hypothetical protein JWO21_1844 [Solirubrobacterales bacterium]|nr:hypothetical protein [Solirubrobacterales bacterium]
MAPALRPGPVAVNQHGVGCGVPARASGGSPAPVVERPLTTRARYRATKVLHDPAELGARPVRTRLADPQLLHKSRVHRYTPAPCACAALWAKLFTEGLRSEEEERRTAGRATPHPGDHGWSSGATGKAKGPGEPGPFGTRLLWAILGSNQ